MDVEGEFILASPRDPAKPKVHSWYKTTARVMARMVKANGGEPLDHWTPHSLRKTVRSNTRRFKIDHHTAEAMLAHKLPKGVVRIYDGYDPADELREAYGLWEAHIAMLARRAGVADALSLTGLYEGLEPLLAA